MTRYPLLVAALALTAGACAEASPSGRVSGAAGTGSGGSGAGAACGEAIESPRCLDSGWCWDAPTPEAADFADVDGTPDGASVWAVGSHGSAFHRCQGAWVPIATGADASLYGVWHPTADLAFAVGEHGTVLRWDGEVWSTLKPPAASTLRAVWGAGPDDVWIGGDVDESGTVLLHFDGTTFERVDSVASAGADIFAIDGRSKADVFAVGGSWDYDASFHFDGTAWNALPTGHTNDDGGPLSAVVASNGATYAIFDGVNTSRLFRFDSGDWTEVLYRQYGGSLHALFDDRDGHAEVIESSPNGAPPYRTLQNEGNDWTPTGETLPALPTAVWAQSASDDAWAVGSTSTLLGHVAGTWQQVPEVVSFPAGPSFVGGSSEQDLWVLTKSAAAHRNAKGWTIEPMPVVAPDSVLEGGVDAAGRPWATTLNRKLLYRDGGTWKTIPTKDQDLDSTFANAPDDIWIASSYTVSHFDGTTWTNSYGQPCPPFNDPGAPNWPLYQDRGRFRRGPDGTVWLVGESGAFQFSSSQQCRQLMGAGGQLFTDDPLVDVAWTPPGDLWAITQSGQLYHREGSYLVARADALGGLAANGGSIEQMVATPTGKLRISYVVPTDVTIPAAIVTFDPATGGAVGAPVLAPEPGLVWTSDDSHAFLAIDGGVLRYGYAE